MSGVFEAVGGVDGCRRLSVAFYAEVEHDPVLRPMHPASMRCQIEALGFFLAQFLGGPREYSERSWFLSLREAHQRFSIGERERTAWLKCMGRALASLPMDDSTRDALNRFFEQSSAFLVNDPEESPRAIDESAQDSVAQSWHEHLVLENVIAALRLGRSNDALAMLPALASLLERDRAASVSLLAMMSASEDPELLGFVRRQIAHRSDLVNERYRSGRTLLHGAAEAGSTEVVELLLQMGADPNSTDQYGHSPLYALANGSQPRNGGSLVRMLVKAGAAPDLQDRVKRCTALHMAARRGNREVAEALLDCGANIEIRDRSGDTPLRRAVNCGKPEIVQLFLSRGADSHSIGSKKLTAFQAARGDVIKRMFASAK